MKLGLVLAGGSGKGRPKARRTKTRKQKLKEKREKRGKFPSDYADLRSLVCDFA